MPELRSSDVVVILLKEQIRIMKLDSNGNKRAELVTSPHYYRTVSQAASPPITRELRLRYGTHYPRHSLSHVGLRAYVGKEGASCVVSLTHPC